MPMKPLQKRATTLSIKKSVLKLTTKNEPNQSAAAGAGNEFDEWLRSKQLLKPDDQEELTEAQLDEDQIKILTSDTVSALKNLVVYSFKEGAYIPVAPTPNTVLLFEYEGTILLRDSEEARQQIEEMGDDTFSAEVLESTPEVAPAVETAPIEEADEGIEEDGEGGEGEGGEGEGGEGDGAGEAGEEEAAPVVKGPKKKLTNQFNFCERAALTYNNPSRCVETQTIPPPRSRFEGNVMQWEIYDSYARDYEIQLREKEKEKKPTAQKQQKKTKDSKSKGIEDFNRRYLLSCQILERMVNQNTYDEIAQDYRYWEDPSDEFRDEEGTLLPLWKFTYEKTKRMNVTDLCFNTLYYDLYAVCFGSFDFMKQNSEGSVCLFTIKNPSYPDYRIITESGAMCCDIHPMYPYLLAVGLYDGNVNVYNLQVNGKKPVYQSHGVQGKHSECVWEVKWGPNMQDGEINFFTISSDGKVFNWVLMQNKLGITTIINLYLENELVGSPDGTNIRFKASGTAMVFHPTNPEIFQVATEEGIIFKCSTAYSSKYLMTYHAHYLSIHRMDYNKFNTNIFASCSGDWRVKVWEDMRSDPLFIFDLGASVGDVRWAPYSSTVFAAVTTEGKVFVFDLNVNKYKAICIQSIVSKKKNKLTRLAFNQKLPFIIVGDDKGTTFTLKLSPNLRLKCKAPKKQQNIDQHTLQVQKLDKLLSLVRELPDGETINDTTTTVASN